MTDKKLRNTPRHLQLAIRDDEELTKILGYVTIFQGGELPFIHTELLPWNSRAKKAKTSQSTTTTKGPRGRSRRAVRVSCSKPPFIFRQSMRPGLKLLTSNLLVSVCSLPVSSPLCESESFRAPLTARRRLKSPLMFRHTDFGPQFHLHFPFFPWPKARSFPLPSMGFRSH